jgi:ATP-dependent helicase HrpA
MSESLQNKQEIEEKKSEVEITFPEELPVSLRRDEIMSAISQHQVVIVCGETGSGKTTQLPKMCLALGRGRKGWIGHTQPRRIAASSTAKRIASELKTSLGQRVGFKVRFSDTVGKETAIKLMTDGILLAEIQSDPTLSSYDTLIIDEAHERSLNIDFILGYLKQLLPSRPDLKVIITSATIDADKFAQHFASLGVAAPIIEVSGRLYPVEIRYRPIQTTKDDKERDVLDAIVDAVDEVSRQGMGDILVFLPGEREIKQAAQVLRGHCHLQTEVLPLFARLSVLEQEKIFKPAQHRRIVLATNVAETSLTVPGIRFVIDTGVARVKRYSYRNKVEQLQIEPIAQSAANQRAGRCGRVASGVCLRLYEEEDFIKRAPFTDPEIARSSLALVILRMKSLRLGEVDNFPFIDPPQRRAIVDGYQLLQELGAVDEGYRLTGVGKQLARLPLDPRVAKMILSARHYGCLTEALIIASALSVVDPRERPLEAQEAADTAHQIFSDLKSEFVSYLKLWQWFEEALEHKKSQRQLQEKCRAQFLSPLRLREWREVHTQLFTLVREEGWKLNETPASYEQLHCAILSGLLGNVGYKLEEEPHYLGARGIKFSIWPGSFLAKKAGRWIVTAELVESTKLYARCVAVIQPEWIEKVGAHLLKKSYGDPRWEKRRGEVVAIERATLYGLVVYNQKRVVYDKIDSKIARDIFIRDALVGGDFETRAPFFSHNQALLREIEKLEHKARRTDVLVDDTLIAAFYDQALPLDVCNAVKFTKWYEKESVHNRYLLFLQREDIMRHEAHGVTTDLFPKEWVCGGVTLPLSYHFEPGSVRDGVTMTIPLYALNQVDAVRCEWLVPGMIKEKIQLLLKSLPQKIRRHCVPLPAYAENFCARVVFGDGDVLEKIMMDIRTQFGVVVLKTDFRLETLPMHLVMNMKVVDQEGRQLGMGRNIEVLRTELGQLARAQFQGVVQKNKATVMSDAPFANTQKIVTWDFGSLPMQMELKRGQQVVMGYPALVDKMTHCVLEIFDDRLAAQRLHILGLARLFALNLKEQLKYLEKNMVNITQMGMQFMSLGTIDELRWQIIFVAMKEVFLIEPLPLNGEEFNQRKESGKPRLGLLVNEIARLVGQILTQYQSVMKKMALLKAYPNVKVDVETQLQSLVNKHFVQNTPYIQLGHYVRYLKAIEVRIDKLRQNVARDEQAMRDWASIAAPWQRALKTRREDIKMVEFRWLLEELRVSLFAQELRTPMPVSAKRLEKVWQSMIN